MDYNWNPFNGESIRHQERPRNFDQRNESYYLGKISEAADSDSSMRYFPDGKTGRYYRKGEIIPQDENQVVVNHPFRNNSY